MPSAQLPRGRSLLPSQRGITRVRYELATSEQGFVISRDPGAARRTLERILASQKAQGHRVRRCRGKDGQEEYRVTEGASEFVARYWLERSFGG